VDLLPDREAECVVAWLKEHPEIEIISRDRSGLYADAARQGDPQAVQVADRWHLLQNLGDAIFRFLDTKHALLKAATQRALCATADAVPAPASCESAVTPPVASEPVRAPTREQVESQARWARRVARYEAVVSMVQLL
jgi:hypothetical protein